MGSICQNTPAAVQYNPNPQKTSPEKCISATDEVDYIIVNKNSQGQNSEGYKNQCSFHFASLQNKVVTTLGKYDPNFKYLCVDDGLNLKGTCFTSGCVAYGKGVWIQLGFGKFQIGKVQVGNKCPCCEKPIGRKTIKTLGYTKAKVVFKGVKQVNGNDVQFNSQQTEKVGKFVKFNELDQNVCSWSWLDVTVTKV